MQNDRGVGAWGSIALLISVAAVKTTLTKFLFTHQVHEPIAYSLLSAVVTGLLVSCQGFGHMRFQTLMRLLPVALAIAVDLGLSNVAISRLPLALQQAIASTIPAATILLETIVRRRCKPLLVYVIIATLCFGAVLGHVGSLSSLMSSNRGHVRGFYEGEAAMMIGPRRCSNTQEHAPLCPHACARTARIALCRAAVLAAAYKYVFAKDLLHAYRQELGPLRLLLWIECTTSAVLLPWSMATHELRQLLCANYTLAQWASLLAGTCAPGMASPWSSTSHACQ